LKKKIDGAWSFQPPDAVAMAEMYSRKFKNSTSKLWMGLQDFITRKQKHFE